MNDGILISDILVTSRADGIILYTENIKYKNTTQKAYNEYVQTFLGDLNRGLANVYTKEQVDALVGQLVSFIAVVVETLPTEDISPTTIYLIEAEDHSCYIEWLYVSGVWRNVGTTQVSLVGFLKQSQFNEYKTSVNNRFIAAEQDIANLKTAVQNLGQAYESLSQRISDVAGAITTINESTNQLRQMIQNIQPGTPTPIDDITAEMVTYEDTNVKEVLDMLLYTPPTVSVNVTTPAARLFEVGSAISAIEGSVGFTTHNGVVQTLRVLCTQAGVTETYPLTPTPEALSVLFRISKQIITNTVIKAEIIDDKDTIVTSSNVNLNFGYKAYTFVSAKESITAQDIPTVGGILRLDKSLGRVTFQCTPTTPYAYIVIPQAYCTVDPTIKDLNGFTIEIPSNLKYTLSDYVNAYNVNVPMRVLRLRNPEEVSITVNVS